jgi:hypothetical protein
VIPLAYETRSILEGVLLLQKPISIVDDSVALTEIPEVSTMGLI